LVGDLVRLDPDVVLMDIMLADGMSGDDVVVMARHFGYGGKVVYVTAVDEVMCWKYHLGLDMVISKPCGIREIAEVLDGVA
jgi:DNA-binding response OmpR family regulator